MVKNISQGDYVLDIDYESLLGKDWADVLRENLINTEYMKNLMIFLNESYKKGGIYPSKSNVFKALESVDFADVRVVMIGREPYNDGNATGIPLANYDKYGKRFSDELLKYFKGIETSIYDGIKLYQNPELDELSPQGVLFLDAALTSTGTKLEHLVYWRNFIRQVIISIQEWIPDVVFVFMGEEAKYFAQYVENPNYKLFCEHPYESVQLKKPWDGEVLNEVNIVLKTMNNDDNPIVW
jgi:uracil-DNA glycosylase